MTIKEEEIDLTGITRNYGTPTLTSITKARREIGRQLQNKVCADPDSKEHGQSYLIYDDIEWLNRKRKESQTLLNHQPTLEHMVEHHGAVTGVLLIRLVD